MPITTRVPYYDLSPEQREALNDWCTLHNLDHTLVPVDADIQRDPDNGDWIIESFIRDSTGVRAVCGTPARTTLRRPFKAELPWPTMPFKARSNP